MASEKEQRWWKEAVVYQIWPHSFCDSNGDGIGDLNGIISKIDYIKELGADVIWLSPVYPSPLVDYGYDISDFKDINPLYGTLEDWDRLRDEADRRGIEIVMDLVLNHCSDKHPWFENAKASRDSPYREFFYWKDGREGPIPEPNNWASQFGGPAWTKVGDDQYYLHCYAPEQPDLNWTNPKLRDAMYEVTRFWLDRGAAGYRLDACSRLSRVDGLPDAEITRPGELYQDNSKMVKHGPHLQEYFQELHGRVLSKHDPLVVGEMSGTSPKQALDAIQILQFDHTNIDTDGGNPLKVKKWTLPEFKAITAKWAKVQSEGGGWCAWHSENHDLGRSISRWCNDSPEYRNKSAKLKALYQACLPGTLYIYQGEELALTNIDESFSIEDLPDVQTQNYWKAELQKRQKATGIDSPDMSDIMDDLRIKARDNGRMPVPWDQTKPNAGFSSSTPWMKMNPKDLQWSAAQQEANPESVLRFWRRLIALRKEHCGLTYGRFELFDEQHPSIFGYTVTSDQDAKNARRYLVVMNWSDSDCKGYPLPDSVKSSKLQLLMGNYETQDSTQTGSVDLGGWEARLYLVD